MHTYKIENINFEIAKVLSNVEDYLYKYCRKSFKKNKKT